MRRFILTNLLVGAFCLAGYAGEPQETTVEPANAVQSAVETVDNPTVPPEQEGSPGTTSFMISVSITIDPGQVPDDSTDVQGAEAE